MRQGAEGNLATTAEAHQGHRRAAGQGIAVGQQAVGNHLGGAAVVDRSVARVGRYRHHRQVAQIDDGPQQRAGVAQAQPIHPAPKLRHPTAFRYRLIEHRIGHDPPDDGNVGRQGRRQSPQEILPFWLGLEGGLADAVEIHHPAPDPVRGGRGGELADVICGSHLFAEPAGPPTHGFQGGKEADDQHKHQSDAGQIKGHPEAAMQGPIGQMQQQTGARQQHQPRHQQQQPSPTPEP